MELERKESDSKLKTLRRWDRGEEKLGVEGVMKVLFDCLILPFLFALIGVVIV